MLLNFQLYLTTLKYNRFLQRIMRIYLLKKMRLDPGFEQIPEIIQNQYDTNNHNHAIRFNNK
jgi:hypothetical protein